jgi:hypothetical protein
MAAPEQYLLDANVFIEAHRRYYAFDLCPGFWESLIHLHGLGRIHSIQRVKDEFTGDDALSKWVATVAPASFFHPDDGEDVQVMFGKMMTWVIGNPQFNDSAKSEFASVADGWLMAYAKVHGLTLVTHEVYARDAKKKVPMPNVCKAFGVGYVNTFEMLQRMSVKFHWGP